MKEKYIQKVIVLTSNTGFSLYKFRSGLIKKLLEENHKVICIANPDDFADKLIQLGCDFIPIKIDSRGINPIVDILTLFSYLKLYFRLKPTLILNYTIKSVIYSSLAASFLKIPFINVITGLGKVFLQDNFVTWLVKKLYRISQNKAKKLLFLNTEDAEVFKLNKLAALEKITILPSEGINLDEFTLIARQSAGNSIEFLFLGRLLVDKGILEFIQAAEIIKKEIPNANFKLLGQLDSNDSLVLNKLNQAEQQGVIEYLGFTEDVRHYIVNTDCVVLPSYREGISKALLEAAAMGRPIIATDVPGCREIVEHGLTGYLCQPKNMQDLANKMRNFLALLPEQRHAMGLAGHRKIIDKFDERKILAIYFDLFKAIGIV